MSKNLFLLQLSLFILLLFLWNVFTPVLEGADESGHFCHADYIAHRGRLPNLNKRDGCFLWHPPFYYLTLVPIIKIFNHPEFGENDLQTNPNFKFLRRGEYAQFVHEKGELFFRWDDFKYLIHTLRLVSSIYGILIFLLAWKVSALVFKKPIYRNLSLLLFFNPMFLHIFTTITNVTLISFLTSLFIAIDISYARKVKSTIITILQGVIFGLGIITKTNIFWLLPAYLILSIIKWYGKSKMILPIIRRLSLFSGATLVISGWYLLRSYNLYKTPFEFTMLVKLDPSAHHLNLLENLGPFNYWHSFVLTVFKTFWSGYGALTVRFPEVINTFLFMISIFILFAIIKQYRKTDIFIKFGIIYIILIIVGLIITNINFAAMHAKDTFIAYIPLALIFSFSLGNLLHYTKKNTIPTGIKFLSIIGGFYILSQQDIVKLIKIFLIEKFNVETFDLIILLMFKLIVVFIVFWLIIKSLGLVKMDHSTALNLTYGLFIGNLVIIAYSTYLFYFRFF